MASAFDEASANSPGWLAHSFPNTNKIRITTKVVFDSETIKDQATFDEPHRYPTGIQYVVVNGEVVIHQDEHTEARPGRVLRKS